jgi:hypothetical protein
MGNAPREAKNQALAAIATLKRVAFVAGRARSTKSFSQPGDEQTAKHLPDDDHLGSSQWVRRNVANALSTVRKYVIRAGRGDDQSKSPTWHIETPKKYEPFPDNHSEYTNASAKFTRKMVRFGGYPSPEFANPHRL